MLIFKLVLSYLFFIDRISNQVCTEEICWRCIETSSNIIINCTCSECPSLHSECSSTDCDICKNYPLKISYHNCLCNKCKKSLGVDKIVGISAGVVLGVIIFILIVYYIKKQQKEKQRKRRILRNMNNNGININNRNIVVTEGNNNNIRFNRNSSYDNNSGSNRFIINRNLTLNFNINNRHSDNKIIYPMKQISLDEILTNEKYLGPKICKKEYQKHNTICTVCLEKFKEDIDMVSLTPCFHLFHNKCLDIYFRKNKNAKCPNCNYDIINHFRNQM